MLFCFFENIFRPSVKSKHEAPSEVNAELHSPREGVVWCGVVWCGVVWWDCDKKMTRTDIRNSDTSQSSLHTTY